MIWRTSLDQFIDDRLLHGRSDCDREEALSAFGLKQASLTAAISRLVKRHRLANPRHGFYLILRPEDQVTGAPDPVRWIDPLMKHQGIDYRASRRRAAAPPLCQQSRLSRSDFAKPRLISCSELQPVPIKHHDQLTAEFSGRAQRTEAKTKTGKPKAMKRDNPYRITDRAWTSLQPLAIVAPCFLMP